MTDEEIDILAEKLTKILIEYKNPKKLDWMEVWKEVLINEGYESELKNHILLTRTVRCISFSGYDIIPDPFKLESYR